MSKKSTDSRTAELVIARPGVFDPGEKHWSELLNIGVAYLAGAARDRGISVKVVEGKNEGHTTIEETVEAVRSYQPKFVGLSAMTTEYPMAIEVASRLKEGENAPVTILGGVHANALPIDSLAESSAFDYVLTGEAEDSLPDLIKAIKSRKGIKSIPGLYRRDEYGKPFSSCPSKVLPDVASLPFPAWDLIPRVSAYPIVTARGCPYDCVFCGKNLGKKVRTRSVEHIMEEMEWLYKGFSPTMISFADETFGMNPGHTEELLGRMIEFNKDNKKIILSHSKIFQDKDNLEKKKETAKAKGAQRATKKAVKNIQDKIEKTTLGDLEALANLKQEIAEEEKKAKENKK